MPCHIIFTLVHLDFCAGSSDGRYGLGAGIQGPHGLGMGIHHGHGTAPYSPGAQNSAGVLTCWHPMAAELDLMRPDGPNGSVAGPIGKGIEAEWDCCWSGHGNRAALVWYLFICFCQIGKGTNIHLSKCKIAALLSAFTSCDFFILAFCGTSYQSPTLSTSYLS